MNYKKIGRVFIILLIFSAFRCNRATPINKVFNQFQQNDEAPPTKTAIPLNGNTLSSLSSIDITFSEFVLNAGNASSYSLTGAGSGSLSITSVTLTNAMTNTYTLSFSGAITNGVIVVTLNAITDLKGNILSGNTINYTGDLSNPTQTANPLSGTKVNSLSTIDITYSKAVTGATIKANYIFSGVGSSALTIGSITNLGSNVYRLNLSGTVANGTITLTINNIKDALLNSLAGNTVIYTGDITSPTKSSTPIAGSTFNALSQIDIAYSEPINGAALLANYNLSGLGKGSLVLSSATLLSGNTYRLTLTGAPTNGAISIAISNVTDIAGNVLSANTINYTGDILNPTQVASPIAGSIVKVLTQVDVSFSENVSGASTTANYIVSGVGAGSLTVTNAVLLVGNTYRLTLTGTPGNGSLNINMNNIRDVYNNSLTGNIINYTGDTTSPTQVASPVNGSMISSLTQIDVTYSESVLGAAVLTNYVLSGSGKGTLVINNAVLLSVNTYRLTLNGSATTGLILVTVNNVTDNIGNILSGNILNYTSDITNPTQTANPANGSALNNVVQVDITFSETVSGAAVKANYNLTGAGVGSLIINSASLVSGNIYRLNFLGTPTNGPINIVMSNISDSSANLVSNNTITYTGDKTSPTQSSNPANASSVSTLPQIDISYSEAVSGATSLGNYFLSGSGVGSLSITNAILVTGNTYRLTLSGSPSNGAFSIIISNIKDTAQNLITSNVLNFTADTTGPSQSSTPSTGSLINALSQIDITFTEAVLGATTLTNYTLTGTGKGSLSLSGVSNTSGNSYRLFIAGAPVTGSLSLNLTGISDLLSNSLQNTSINYSTDVSPPTQSSLPASGSSVNALGIVDITYSEVVTGATNLANYSLSGSGKGTLAITNVALLSGNSYRLTFSGTPVNGNVVVTISAVSDVASNLLSGNTINYLTDISNPTQSASPLSGSTLKSLNQIDITYSKGVIGAASTSNYALSGSGSGSLTVTNATLLSGNTYRLTLGGTIGNGALSITIFNVKDASLNLLSGNIISYIGDINSPTKTSSPASGTSLNSLTQLDVSYSEPVSGASTLSNYVLSGSGTGSLIISSVSNISGNNYRLLLSGSPSSGTINITINNVTDTVGNILSANLISYSADTSNPTHTSNPTNAALLKSLTQLDIVFSEPVTGASTAVNYLVSGAGAGTLSVSSAVWVSGNTYRITFSGTITNGLLVITMSNIKDVNSNALASNIISFTGDVLAPSQSASPVSGSSVSSLSQVDITYSEAVSGASTLGFYFLSGSGSGTLSITNATLLSANTYRLTLTGTSGNGPINITVSGVTDTAGNALSNTGIAFTGDTSNPTQGSSPVAGTTLNSLPQIDITYSEAVNGAALLANYVLAGVGKGSLTIISASNISGNVYRLTTSGTVSNGSIVLTINGVTDLTGNSLTANTDGFIADTTPPTVSSTSPANNATNIAVNTAISVTLNEGINAATMTTQASDGACSGSLQLSNDNFTTCKGGTLSGLSNPTFAITLASNLANSTTYKIRVTTTVTDAIGNNMASVYTSANGFTTASSGGGDTTPPNIVSISPSDGSTNVTVQTPVSIVFDESIKISSLTIQAVTGVCSGNIQISFDNFTTCIGDGTTVDVGLNPTIKVYPPHRLFEYSGATPYVYKVKVTNGVTDQAGNLLANPQIQATGFTTIKPTCTATQTSTLGAAYTTYSDIGATCTGASAITNRDNGDGTITDLTNGLLWTKCSMSATSGTLLNYTSSCTGTLGTFNFTASKAACIALNFQNRKWALADAARFQTLIKGTVAPRIDSTFFPNVPSVNSYFWTFTEKNLSISFEVRFHDLGTLPIYASTKTISDYVRCVAIDGR